MAPSSILRNHPYATRSSRPAIFRFTQPGNAFGAHGFGLTNGRPSFFSFHGFVMEHAAHTGPQTNDSIGRRTIPHLRWWIGGILFASTVIN